MTEEAPEAAAIDIGSNSCRLLIVSRSDGELMREYYDMEITRLGKGIEADKELTETAEKRTFAALKKFKKEISTRNISRVKAVGTSALRDANNAERFCNKIEKQLSIPVEIVSGRQEAKLVFAGVNSFPRRDVELVIDIGGGSTEVIRGKEKNELKALSLEMGAVRYTERYIPRPESIVSEKEQELILKAARDCIEAGSGNLSKITEIECFFGVGGTITTLAAVAQQMKKYRPEKVENFLLSLSRIEKITKFLSHKELEERKKIPGLEPERADVIVAGSLILAAFMRFFGFSEIRVSDRGILFGIIAQYLL